MPLTPEETSRYQRHLSLAGFGPAAQEINGQSRIHLRRRPRKGGLGIQFPQQRRPPS